MSRRKMNRALSVANPIDADQVEALDLDRAERELLSDIVAEPQDSDVAARAARAGGLWRGRTVTRFLTIGAASACAVLALFAFNSSGGSPAKPESAFAAELARISEDSEVVVLDPSVARELEPSTSKALEDSRGWSGWSEIPTVYDCTELPCVKKTAAELGGVGFEASQVKTKHGGKVAVVIPPADGEIPPADGD